MSHLIGSGFDRHRLVEGRPLILGGVEVESPVGCDAHSDGDVLLHALVDGLLGAAGMGDIGDHFPPSDPQWKDAKSETFLTRVLGQIRPRHKVVNVDATVFLETPKLGPHKEVIGLTVARLLDVPAGVVNIKAKTGERVGAVGRGECVDAHVSVLLEVV